MENKEVNRTLAEIPAGECFRVGDHEMVVLEHCAGATRALRKDLYVEHAEFGSNNNFDGSYTDELCQRFAEELKAIVGEENLLEHEVDLTSDDGLKDYGSVSRLVSLLTAEQYRTYVEILDQHKAKKWWWLATPFSTPRHADDYWTKCVSPSGIICDDGFYFAYGVRPFCIFKSSISVSV